MYKEICKTVEFCMILLALFGLQSLILTGIYLDVLPMFAEEPLTLVYATPSIGILALGGVKVPGLVRRGV